MNLKLAVIFILIFIFFTIFAILKPAIESYFIIQNMTEIIPLNLTLTKDYNYTFEINRTFEYVKSLSISGSYIGEGDVFVYLNGLLVADKSAILSAAGIKTSQNITTYAIFNETTNQTEIVNETEIETEYFFEDLCVSTCDLGTSFKEKNLTLSFKISNATLKVNKISYDLIVSLIEENVSEEIIPNITENVSQKNITEMEFTQQTDEGLYYEKTVTGSGEISIEIPEDLTKIDVSEKGLKKDFNKIKNKINVKDISKSIKIKGVIPKEKIIKFDKSVYSHPPGVRFEINFYVKNPLNKKQKFDLVLPFDKIEILEIRQNNVPISFSDYKISGKSLKYQHPSNFKEIGFSQDFEPGQLINYKIIAKMPEEKGEGKFYFDILGDFVFSVDPWWNNNWLYRKQITITNNNNTDALPSGFQINFTFDSQTLISDNKMLANGNDARIVFQNSSGNYELDRLNVTPFNLVDTQIFFKTQEDISAGGSDNRYYLYYGNPSAGSPPNDTNKVFQKLQPDSSTVGLWHMDEGSGNYTNDSSGNGNDGTLYNGTTICNGGDCPTWVGSDGGFIDNTSYNFSEGDSIGFDGDGDYVNCGNDTSLNPTSAISIETWIKPATLSPSDIMRIVQRASVTWGTYINTNGKVYFYTDTRNDGGAWKSVSAALPTANTWYHVVGTYNGSLMKLYINGSFANEITQTNNLNSGGSDNLSIGSNGNSQYFNGTIDEVAIYNRSLSPEEIKYHYWRRMYFAPEPTASLEAEVNQTCLYDSGTTTLTANLNCYDLNITNGATLTTNDYNITVENDFNLINGTFNANASYIEVGRNWDSSSADATFNYGTSTVNLTGTGNLTFSNNQYFYNLIVANPGETTTIPISGFVVYVAAKFTIAGGTFEQGQNAVRVNRLGVADSDPFEFVSGSTWTSGPSNWFGEYCSDGGTCPVRSVDYPNALGLYKVSGNPPTFNFEGNITAKYIWTGSDTILNTQNYNVTITNYFRIQAGVNATSSIIDVGAFVQFYSNGYMIGGTSVWYVDDYWTSSSTSSNWDPGTSKIIFDGGIQQNISTMGTITPFYDVELQNPGTVLYLKNDTQMRNLNITEGTELRMDAVSEAKNLTLYFSDLSGAGFDSTSAGNLTTIGDENYGVTITSINQPPTNYWEFTIQPEVSFSLTSDYTTFSYYNRPLIDNTDINVDNSIFDYSNQEGFYYHAGTIFISFNNNTISNSGKHGLAWGRSVSYATIDNLTITNIGLKAGTWYDISVDHVDRNASVEFTNSNFDEDNCYLGKGIFNIISKNHNDVSNAYKVIATTLNKSSITNDFDINDNVEIVNGTLILDENATAQTILIDSDATLQIGEDSPTKSIWLKFADVSDAGFNNSTSGALVTKGTATYSMYVTSVNELPTNYWSLKTVGMDMAMNFTTVSYYDMKWIWGWGGRTVDVENCVFNYGKSYGFYHTGTAWTSFINNTLSNSVDSGLYVDYSGADPFIADNITITNSGIYDIRIKNKPHIEFNNSNFNTSLIWYNPTSTYHAASIISDNHNDVSNSYKIWIEPEQNLSKSNITNDFTSFDNVELLNGTLIIDEPAQSNNFTIDSGSTLNITSSFSVIDTLNQTGNLNIYNNQDVVVNNLYVDESKLYVAPNSSLYALNVNGNPESKVWGDFHYKTNTTGLVGWWRFNEGSGNTTADSSGNGNDGTLKNGTVTCNGEDCPTWTNGKFGNAISFDGENDYVSVPDSPTLDGFSDGLSVTFWINPDNFVGWKFFIVKGSVFMIGRASDTSTLQIRVYNQSQQASPYWTGGSLTVGNWNFVALTHNVADGAVKGYINGANVISETWATDSISDWDTALQIGGMSNYFQPGVIDEVKIYNRSLSASEILEEYIKGLQNHNITAVGNITIDSNNEVAYDNVTANLTNVKTIGNFTIRGKEAVLTTLNITSGSEFKLDSVNANQNTTLKFNDVSGAGFTSDSAGTLIAKGNETYRVTITSINQPPTNKWQPSRSVYMSIIARFTTFSYYSNIGGGTSGVIYDIENCTFSYGRLFFPYGGLSTFIFNNNTFDHNNGGTVGQLRSTKSATMNNIVFTNTEGGIEIWTNVKLEFTNSNFNTSSVTLADSDSNIISSVHNDIANAYKIIATTLSKSSITNDFTSTDNVELINGTLTIDEQAQSNNFTINSGTTLTVDANNFTAYGILNQTGTLNIINNADVISANSIIDLSKLTIDSDSSLYAKNYDLNTNETRVYGDFHYTSETPQLPEEIDNDETGLVGLWHMNEGSGDTVSDSSGNGNDGTRYGATWTTGKFDGALDFDGDDDYVNISHSSSLNATEAVTIAGWFRYRTSGKTWQGLVTKSAPNSDFPASYRLNLRETYDRKVYAYFHNSTKIVTSVSTTQLNPDTWYYIAAVFNGTHTQLYVNGTLEDSDLLIGPLNSTTHSVYIGKSAFNLWNGTIDEVAIYNRSLSAEEIKQLYGIGLEKHRTIIAENGLDADNANLKFKNVTIQNSGNDYDLYLTNSNITAFNLTFNDVKTSLSGKNIAIKNVTNPPSTSGYNSINKFLNISNTGNGNVLLNISYTGSPTNEANLKIYKWTGTAWTVESNTGVNTNEKYVWANITPSSIYAPLSPVEAPPTPPGAPAAGLAPALIDFSIEPSSITVSLAKQGFAERSITIKNTGEENITITIDTKNLKDHVLEIESFDLDVNQSKTISLTILAGPKLGVITGSISITGNGVVKKLPIIIEVESERILFDAKIDIPPEYERIFAGDELKTQITLFPIGPSNRTVDVILTYLIKDLENKIVLTESETFAVSQQVSYTKTFSIPSDLKTGTYVAAIEVVYENSFATSSALFDVIERKVEIKNLISIVILITIFSGLVIHYLIWRKERIFYKRKKK